MFRELMAIMTSQMMTSRSLICLLENQNGGKLQKNLLHISRLLSLGQIAKKIDSSLIYRGGERGRFSCS
jgi:hypothetical protein